MDDQSPLQTGAVRPDPVVTIDSKEFWEGADRGELIIQQCATCETMHHPPRPVCPKCHAINMRGVKMSGAGTVYSWVMPIHPAPYGFAIPPIVALIDLKEGPRLLSNIVGVDPREMKIGIKVQVDFEKTEGGHQVPVFRAAGKRG